MNIKLSLLITFLTLATSVMSQQPYAYHSLDQSDPICFGGDHIVYQGERIELGARSFFIDARLPDEVAARYPYVFNTVNEAVEHIIDGTEDEPMTLYIAPYVYWLDDPDDPAIRVAKEGESLPYAIILKCNWLRFHGLNKDPRHVVLAVNRGQTMGAKGNYTMFKMSGDGITTENITLGNYCNIDLEYPLLPQLNRTKRGSAIVQAQLVICDSDKVFARNCRFVSRLNLNPFFGSGKRTLFVNCHFESTDDALCKTAVYLNCDFDFYSSKPFGSTILTGSVFLNCDLRSFTTSEQYFTKGGGQVAVLHSRLKSETAHYWGWRDIPADESRNYQQEVTLNEKPYIIGGERNPRNTVQLGDKPLLDAYYFKHDGQIHYNIYNLLKGNDDWDPLHMKECVREAEERDGKSYTNLPTQLLISTTRDTIETAKSRLLLRLIMKRFGNFDAEIRERIQWSISPQDRAFAQLSVNDRQECEVIPTNQTDHLQQIVVSAVSASGLEAASVVYILPEVLEAPAFVGKPTLRKEDGKLLLDYTLDTRYPDQSLITWYRCDDKNGINPIEVAVSRMNDPMREYVLTAGDCGKYLMAKIMPKDLRSLPGEATCVISKTSIRTKDVRTSNKWMDVDFKTLSSSYQPLVLPGYWTLDCYAPEDTRGHNWEADNSVDPWYYGPGINGAANAIGFVQAIRGARMRYTPVGTNYGDMKISFTAVPAKTAGQGFGSATAQYMDIFIKFDTQTMNGYALRIVRTTKYHDAVDFVFMRYENGKAHPISEPITTSCYNPECRITVEVRGNKLIAQAELLGGNNKAPRANVANEINMETEIQLNPFGGVGFQHTGTVHGGATLIKDMRVEWPLF